MLRQHVDFGTSSTRAYQQTFAGLAPIEAQGQSLVSWYNSRAQRLYQAGLLAL